MQAQHRRLRVARGEQRPYVEAASNCGVDQRLFPGPRRAEHVRDDFLLARGGIARVSDADPQAPEIVAAEAPGNVVAAVMAAGAAAELESYGARRQIELVVHDQYLLWLDLVEACQRRHRAARLIHVSRRQQQP